MGEKSYFAVVFDASFCLIGFSDHALTWLPDGSKYYAAESTRSAYLEFCETFSSDASRLARAKDSFSILENLVEFRAEVPDTWCLLRALMQEGAHEERQILMVTADRSLMRRMMLTELPVDLYDLTEMEVIPWTTFPDQKDRWSFLHDYPLSIDNRDLVYDDKIEVFNEDGELLSLEYLTQGAEAGIYKVEHETDRLAKIFPQGRMSPEKRDNIRFLSRHNKNSGFPWFLLPNGLLYWDRERKTLAGFLQEYIGKDKSALMDHPYYDRELGEKSPVPNFGPKETLRRCACITRQSLLLNYLDIGISDYNLANFALSTQHPEFVYMWDTDSFFSRNFFPNMEAPDLKIYHDYDCMDPLAAFYKCSEYLYACVYKMLTVGGKLALGTKTNKILNLLPDNELDGGYLRLMPPDVLALYIKLYGKELGISQEDNILTAEALLHVLHLSKAKQITLPYYDRNYDDEQMRVPRYMDELTETGDCDLNLPPWKKEDILQYFCGSSEEDKKEFSGDTFLFTDYFVPSLLSRAKNPSVLHSNRTETNTRFTVVSVKPGPIGNSDKVRSRRFRRRKLKKNVTHRFWGQYFMYILLLLITVSVVILLWICLKWDGFPDRFFELLSRIFS